MASDICFLTWESATIRALVRAEGKVKEPLLARAQKLNLVNNRHPSRFIIDCNMFDLPAELALAIVAYLPLSSVAVLPQVSHDWSSFIQRNREPIYHNSAIWHGFIPSMVTSPGELRQSYSMRSLKGVNGWYDFCKSGACTHAAIEVTIIA